MKFRTPYNSGDFPKTYETNFSPSKTIPDQSMSIREIMDRFARGLPIDGAKVPVYEGEESPLPLNWETMDLSERMDYLAAAKQNTKDIQAKLQKQDQAKREKQIKSDSKKEFEKEQKEIKPAPSAGKSKDLPNDNTEKIP